MPTKVRLVKTTVFPVVMYGCESWTVKKAECRRIDAFELWCWRRLLRVRWTARRSNQSILRETSPGCSLEGIMLRLKLQYFGHLAGSQHGSSHPWQRSCGEFWCGEFWWARRARTRGVPLWASLNIYPKTKICLFYHFTTFTNSSDINGGLSPTTFLCKKINLKL